MIDFMVVGEPAPQGSKRHVGRGIMVESSKKVKPWRETVAAEAAVMRKTIQGPVSLAIIFYLRRPKSLPKREKFPSKKPDLDKLVRSTLDALVTGGIIEDDARVVALEASKRYAETGRPTGASIVLQEAGGNQQ